jgi:hypothetical protein
MTTLLEVDKPTLDNKPNIVRVSSAQTLPNFYRVEFDKHDVTKFIATYMYGKFRTVVASDELEAYKRVQTILDGVYGKEQDN